jgi:hypothetical protein
MSQATSGAELPSALGKFYLMRGGPIYRLMVTLRLEGIEHAYVGRRSILLIAIGWVPLLVLSLAQGLALPGRVRIPFLLDFPAHVLFLVTLPLLIIAEVVIEPGISQALETLPERGLVRAEDRHAFASVLAWARARCDSGWSELILVLLALPPVILFRGAQWTQYLTDSWALEPGSQSLSLAGYWSLFVGGFFARVLLYRWVWRLILWTRLLRRISRLDLNTVAAHPDRAGGLGFMAEVEMRFGILAFAVGSVVSANVAANILFHHATLASEKFVVIAYIAGATVIFVLPLLALAGTLNKTWRRGLHDYGRLAHEYVRRFERKWIRGENPPGDELLGTSDIQSLSDLVNSYQIVHEIKLMPMNRRCLIVLAISAALPMVPLVFLDPWAMELAKKLLGSVL